MPNLLRELRSWGARSLGIWKDRRSDNEPAVSRASPIHPEQPRATSDGVGKPQLCNSYKYGVPLVKGWTARTWHGLLSCPPRGLPGRMPRSCGEVRIRTRPGPQRNPRPDWWTLPGPSVQDRRTAPRWAQGRRDRPGHLQRSHPLAVGLRPVDRQAGAGIRCLPPVRFDGRQRTLLAGCLSVMISTSAQDDVLVRRHRRSTQKLSASGRSPSVLGSLGRSARRGGYRWAR
jgi:hypothetical protein